MEEVIKLNLSLGVLSKVIKTTVTSSVAFLTISSTLWILFIDTSPVALACALR